MGDLCAFGVDDLLTYHYLVSEFFMVAPLNLSHAAFFALPKTERAAAVWAALFVERTPLSEACVGVLTTLRAFPELRHHVEQPTRAALPEMRAFFASVDRAAHARRVFDLAGVASVVCTNVPFDAREASEFVTADCCVDVDAETFADADVATRRDADEDERFKTALRVDALLKGDWATVEASLVQRGLPATVAGARAFLTASGTGVRDDDPPPPTSLRRERLSCPDLVQ